MKTFRQFLEEAKKILGGDAHVISLYHHPIHGTHHTNNYGGHDSIRKKVGSKSDDAEFEHTGFARRHHNDPKTVEINHYGKMNHHKEFENQIKKHYKIGKDEKITHKTAW